MIRIFTGKVGSGKTISAVADMYENEINPNGLKTFSNIITKSKGKYALKKNTIITREMFIKKELVKTTKTGNEIYNYSFNKEFWEKQKGKGFNIILDEAHTLVESRAFSSRQNRIMNEFVSVVRKIATNPLTDSTLTLITQHISAIDIRIRRGATEIRQHICMYEKLCSKCGAYWTEHNELPDYKKNKQCPNCESYKIKKVNHRILAHYFDSLKDYEEFLISYDDNLISRSVWLLDIDELFNFYDTAQLDDLVSD